ncbi:hypothetical protein NEAUS03_0869 [Nematocida ausubeli]|nr:hypothetical protein NEAUS03_0869 [Nematocida ausubeli]
MKKELFCLVLIGIVKEISGTDFSIPYPQVAIFNTDLALQIPCEALNSTLANIDVDYIERIPEILQNEIDITQNVSKIDVDREFFQMEDRESRHIIFKDKFYFGKPLWMHNVSASKHFLLKIIQTNKPVKSLEMCRNPERISLIYGMIKASSMKSMPFIISALSEKGEISDVNSENYIPQEISLTDIHTVILQGSTRSIISQKYLQKSIDYLSSSMKSTEGLNLKSIRADLTKIEHVVRIHLASIIYEMNNALDALEITPFSNNSVNSFASYKKTLEKDGTSKSLQEERKFIKENPKIFQHDINTAKYMKVLMYNTVNQIVRHIKYSMKITQILNLSNKTFIYKHTNNELSALYNVAQQVDDFDPYSIDNKGLRNIQNTVKDAILMHYDLMILLKLGIVPKMIELRGSTRDYYESIGNPDNGNMNKTMKNYHKNAGRMLSFLNHSLNREKRIENALKNQLNSVTGCIVKRDKGKQCDSYEEKEKKMSLAINTLKDEIVAMSSRNAVRLRKKL